MGKSANDYLTQTYSFLFLIFYRQRYIIDVLFGVWLSLVERFVRDEEVACSNHVIPILQGFQYGYVSKSLAGAGEPV